ncbi:Acetylornithine deacetylase/Succinyl-diaminopimelate desuccinylase [Dyadobacter koreensis]|uniref:Acetylornithine deacetylase/Succinyl-diaminopimelate desuccinylase n=1 Tax=Dyadobacter koreensis TaxID=408657 RepID=A0A1H6ZWG8_9BACT|nr:dipeptidase [Dyadobacter koreensis]SEJ57813.1 Acetylornithine deacetylase/Succinyl-diaminopimelate desuccinylase [Dyadobacter koreensis]
MNNYIEKNRDKFLNELLDLIRIPSVSADSKFKNDMIRAAEFVRDSIANAGADKAQIFETPGHPIVYGEKIIDPSLPTVLVYGHYDVQPADPYELWNSPPFEPVIKNDRIYARGACDDKGQFYMHVKALETMLATNTLTCNIKMMIEGEEEVGSSHLETFVKANREMLKCDTILISDTSMIANDVPSIETGLRGLTYLEVEVVGANRDLHSGVYGGGVANPINVLCEMIASLKDENGHITIPGFYDNVEELTASQRAALNAAPFDLNEYKKDLSIEDVSGELGYTTIERTSVRPTLDVNGIWGGYIGEGAKTVLPSKANAKISMRLVPNQSDQEICDLFTKHFEAIAPSSVRVKIVPHHGGLPYVTPTDSIEYKAAEMAMEESFGKKPIPTRGGGSIPIVALFEQELGRKSILMGFGLDIDGLHGPNESYGLFNFYKGIETIPLFFKHYAKLKKGE